MDDDLDFVGGEAKEPAGFDDFKGFVEHGGRIDGDFAAHAPGGMIESILEGGVFDFFCGSAAERAAAGGEDDFFDLFEPAGLGGLKDGGMFGINGEELDIIFLREGNEQ